MNVFKRGKYYYCRNSFRIDGKTTTHEIYLGLKKPKSLNKFENQLFVRMFDKKYLEYLNNIKRNFNLNWKKMPISVKKKYLIDLSVQFTYNTNAIEGSTITLDETDELIKKHISPNKKMDDVVETINHSKVFLDIFNSKIKLNSKQLLIWHKEIFLDTKPDIAGMYRDYLVRVGNYRAPDWQDVKKMLRNYFLWYEKNKNMNPIELCARMHYKFEKIHSFGDGNGRIGRLIIAYILKQKNYPVNFVSYKKRKQYYKALTKNENDFVKYYLKNYIKHFANYLN